MIKGLGFRVYDLIKLVIKSSICTPSSCYKNVALAGHPNSCSLTRKAGVFVHIFFRVTGTLHRGRGGSVFQMRLFVCSFVCLFLCASEQQYREFVSSSSSCSSS